MTPTLTLEAIHGGNWRIPLSVREEQKHYVSDPARLLARAYALRHQRSVARYIALNGTPIGMLMYHDWEEDECYVLSQFFIDQRWQGQGHGFAAMQLVLDEFRRDGRYHQVALCYCEGDLPAMRLYEKCGFVHTGVVDEDEVMMRLELLPTGNPSGANACCTCFTITGNFDPRAVTARLQLQPFEAWQAGDPMPGGRGAYHFSQWSFGKCDTYCPCTEEQMRRTIAPLLDKVDILNTLRQELNVSFCLEIVPAIHPYESTPCLSPPLDVIDFCHATRTEIDIDLYIEGD